MLEGKTCSLRRAFTTMISKTVPQTVTKEVVEVAQDNLVIGQA